MNDSAGFNDRMYRKSELNEIKNTKLKTCNQEEGKRKRERERERVREREKEKKTSVREIKMNKFDRYPLLFLSLVRFTFNYYFD